MTMRRKVLEVGFGGVPFGMRDWHSQRVSDAQFAIFGKGALALFARELLPPDVHYTSVDTFPADVKVHPGLEKQRYVAETRGMLTRLQQEYDAVTDKSRVACIQQDATRLSFNSRSFDEVHLHWVLTSPDVTPTVADMMLSEAHRVLVPQGVVIVTGEMFRTDIIMQRASFSDYGTHAQVHDGAVCFAFAPYAQEHVARLFRVEAMVQTAASGFNRSLLTTALQPSTVFYHEVSELIMVRKDCNTAGSYADAFVVVGKKR